MARALISRVSAALMWMALGEEEPACQLSHDLGEKEWKEGEETALAQLRSIRFHKARGTATSSMSTEENVADEGQAGNFVCYFVNSDTVPIGRDGRERAKAVADTWVSAANASNISRVYYVVDEAAEPFHLPEGISQDRTVPTISADYADMGRRTRSTLVSLNSRALKKDCAWFCVVDDDTYVNTEHIEAKLAAHYNASEPHYMGKLYPGSADGEKYQLVHGSLRMMSRAAVPRVAGAVGACDDWTPGVFGDILLGRCLFEQGQLHPDSAVHPKQFGNSMINNSRVDEGNTTDTLSQVMEKVNASGESLRCLDFVHKLLPQDMVDFHARFQSAEPCGKQL